MYKYLLKLICWEACSWWHRGSVLSAVLATSEMQADPYA